MIRGLIYRHCNKNNNNIKKKISKKIKKYREIIKFYKLELEKSRT